MNSIERQRILVLSVIVIVVVGLGIFLFFQAQDEPSDFRITTLAFASTVSDDYKYEAQEVFTIGEDVWVYAELTGYPEYATDVGSQVLLAMELVAYDNQRGIVDDWSGNLLNLADFVEDSSTLKMAAALDTTGFTPGVYSLEITFIDLLDFQPLITERQVRLVS